MVNVIAMARMHDMSESPRTIDEFYKKLMLPKLLSELRKLQCSVYKRARPGAQREVGWLLSQQTLISLTLTLDYLITPKRRGPSPLTASAKLEEWERIKRE